LLLGRDVESLDGAGLKVAVEQHNLFAKLSPEDKARVVRAL
jgi:Mg2+-importing ATPase